MDFYPTYITSEIQIEDVKKLIKNSDGTYHVEGTSKIYDNDNCIGEIYITIPKGEMKMNETYLMINGQKIELTDEQKKALGIVEKNCFDRADFYHYIGINGKIKYLKDNDDDVDNQLYAVANYCIDKELMKQRSLHETLNRLLWRYSMTHDGDKIDWNDTNQYKYRVFYSYGLRHFDIDIDSSHKSNGEIYFYAKDIAGNAIEEIIKPFMKEHPDFVW